MNDFLVAMVILVGLSSLPFLNELITNENGTLLNWLASPKIQENWQDENGKILGYSKLRVFLYYFFTQIYILIASIGWFTVAKGKSYRNALLVCSASSLYQIFIILSENRKTWLNDYELKLWLTLGIIALLFAFYIFTEFKNRKKLKVIHATFGSSSKIISLKVVLVWLFFAVVSTLPYLHDIISPRGLGIQEWIPFNGFEHFVKLGERNFLGFTSYRALTLTVFVQLFAQIMWAGWWQDAKYSLYKPFLLVPLILSLYELSIIMLVQKDAYLNKTDLKIYLIILSGVFLAILYYFKNKQLPKKKQTIIDVVHHNKNN